VECKQAHDALRVVARACKEWSMLHRQLHDELHLMPWEWLAIETRTNRARSIASRNGMRRRSKITGSWKPQRLRRERPGDVGCNRARP